MRLNHNLASLNIYRNQVNNIKTQSSALNNISSGYKVNSAKDNPNAMAQSERMRMQIRGLQMAGRNVQDGIGMLNTVDGALDSITSMLGRIKELTMQAGGTADTDDRGVIQGEIKQMVEGIDKVVDSSQFNGIGLLNDKGVGNNDMPNYMKMPSGANVDEKIEIPVYNLSTKMIGDESTGKMLDGIDVTTSSGRSTAMNIVDGALDRVLSTRSKYGALQNRFESLYENLDSMGTTIQGAESGIRDADIAQEMMEYARTGLLVEAGNAMMVQSNNFPKEILKVLENVK